MRTTPSSRGATRASGRCRLPPTWKVATYARLTTKIYVFSRSQLIQSRTVGSPSPGASWPLGERPPKGGISRIQAPQDGVFHRSISRGGTAPGRHEPGRRTGRTTALPRVVKPPTVRCVGPVDTAPLASRVLRLSDRAWSREDRTKENRFPCFHHTRHVIFRFIAGNGDPARFYSRPAWRVCRPWLLPVMRQAARYYGFVEPVFPKAMLARLESGHGIDRHVDGGGSNPLVHKIHVPIQTDPAAVLFVQRTPACTWPRGTRGRSTISLLTGRSTARSGTEFTSSSRYSRGSDRSCTRRRPTGSPADCARSAQSPSRQAVQRRQTFGTVELPDRRHREMSYGVR